MGVQSHTKKTSENVVKIHMQTIMLKKDYSFSFPEQDNVNTTFNLHCEN